MKIEKEKLNKRQRWKEKRSSSVEVKNTLYRKDKLRQQSGITLIALIITVIILVILATISINGLLGDNGLISQSRKQKESSSNQVEEERQQTNETTEEYNYIMSEKEKELKKEWVNSISGSGEDKFLDVIETSDGGYLAVGYSTSTDLWFTNKGNSDAIIVKYDMNGKIQWKDSIGGTGADWYSGVIENNGNYIVVGSICSPSVTTKTTTLEVEAVVGISGDTSYIGAGIIMKYDKSGNEIFIKKYEGEVTTDCNPSPGSDAPEEWVIGHTLCYSIEKNDTGYVVTAQKGYIDISDMSSGVYCIGPALLEYSNSDILQAEKCTGGITTYGSAGGGWQINSYNNEIVKWNVLTEIIKKGNNYVLYGKQSTVGEGSQSRIIRTTSDFTVEKEIIHKNDLGTIGRDYIVATNALLDISRNMIVNLKGYDYENGSICKMDTEGNEIWIKEDADYKDITKVNNEIFSAIQNATSGTKLQRYTMESGTLISEYDMPSYENIFRTGVEEAYIFLGSPTDEEGISINGESDAVIGKYLLVDKQ